MNLRHYQKLLLETEQRLLEDLARLSAEGRESRDAEVHDRVDEATSTEGKESAFQQGTLEYQTLVEVRAALGRIADGTYGRCVVCNREIEPARLEAVPWTPFCLEHQEERDRANEAETGSTL